MRVCFLENVIFAGRYFSAGEVAEIEYATETLIADGLAAPVQGESAEPEAEVIEEVESVEEVAQAVEPEAETVEVKAAPKRKAKAKATKVEDAIAAIPEVE